MEPNAVEVLRKGFSDFQAAHTAALDKQSTRIGKLEDTLKSEVSEIKRAAVGSGWTGRAVPLDGDIEIPEDPEYRKGWRQWVRKGADIPPDVLRTKTISIGVPTEGGNALPREIDQAVYSKLRDLNVVRKNAMVIPVSSSDFRRIQSVGTAGASWVGETAARPATSTPTFQPIVPTFGEMYSNPQVTQQSLDDLVFRSRRTSATSWLRRSRSAKRLP